MTVTKQCVLHGERLARLEEKVDSMYKKMDEFISSADVKYAPAWIVRIMSWAMGILSTIIAGLMIYIITNKLIL